MNDLERYQRALQKALRAAEAELGYLESTADELLGANPARVRELGDGAVRLARRLERRGRVLRGRAEALAGALNAEGPSVQQLRPRLERDASTRLEGLALALRAQGGALEEARQRYRDRLQLGRAVARSMLRSIGAEPEKAATRRRATGLIRASSTGVLNRRA